MLGVVTDLDDLLGAEVTRIRTFEKYLDGKPEADPSAKFPDDSFMLLAQLEDLTDLVSLQEAADEPARPYNEFLNQQ